MAPLVMVSELVPFESSQLSEVRGSSVEGTVLWDPHHQVRYEGFFK